MSPAPASLQPSTAADLLERFRLAGGNPGRLITVGGGAGLHWITAGANGDDSAAGISLRTRDNDFQFHRSGNDPSPTATIDMFAHAVGGRGTWPGIDHATPEIAHVLVSDYFGPEEPLIVDFLVDVVGIDPGEIARHAEIVDAEASDGSHLDIRLAHPVHALLGVVENYLRLPQRRNGEPLSRVDRLPPVVRTCISRVAREAVTETTDREVARELEHDARWSMQTLAEKCAIPRYANFTLDMGRDLIEAIPEPEDVPVKPKFWDQEYARRGEKVDRRRRAVTNSRNASGKRTP